MDKFLPVGHGHGYACCNGSGYCNGYYYYGDCDSYGDGDGNGYYYYGDGDGYGNGNCGGDGDGYGYATPHINTRRRG